MMNSPFFFCVVLKAGLWRVLIKRSLSFRFLFFFFLLAFLFPPVFLPDNGGCSCGLFSHEPRTDVFLCSSEKNVSRLFLLPVNSVRAYVRT